MLNKTTDTDSLEHRTFRIFLICFFLIFFALPDLYSQESGSDTPPVSDRIFFGGSFGLQFGTITDIEFSPIIGLWVLPRLAVATGPDYRYYKDPVNKTDILGGRIYTQFVVVRDIGSVLPIGSNIGIFLHAENELLSLKSDFWKNPPYETKRFYVNTVLAGVGISQQIGRKAALNFIVLWALNDSNYDIYSNPEFRISLTF